MLLRSIALLCLIFLSSATSGYCAPAKSSPIFAALKKRYLTLRNTDHRLEKIDQWKSIASEFLRAVDKHPKDPEAASALLNASIVFEELFRSRKDKSYLKDALNHLNRIARDYPGDKLADDALLRRADLLFYDAGDRRAARRNYQEIIEAYPSSDMFDIAVARVNSMDGQGNLAQPHVEEPIQDSKTTESDYVVVLDPGHGGEDLGAVGPSQLLEKDVVLAIAFELEKLLKAVPKMNVILTRRRDDFVPLAERTAIANAANADVMVSLHANASVKKNMSGYEIYYLDNAGDKSSKALAERENASVQYEGAAADLHYMISDLIQYGKRDASIELAKTIGAKFSKHLSPKWNNIRNLGVKRAPFYVLVGAHMPCVLVEMFFIDHKIDGTRLAQTEFRQDIARSLHVGIMEFLNKTA